MAKTGLVLEGGAMRGMFTAGVLDTLMENGIQSDGVIGVSAGALFGVNYVSKQKRRVLRYNKRFNKDKDYIGLRPLLKEGNILSTHYAYEVVPQSLDRFDNEAFMKAGIPFYAVASDIDTGRPKYFRLENVFAQMDILRASGSMPFVSRPVEIHGRKYLDGGITDSIPFEWMYHQGYDKLIVVLTRDISYRKTPMNPLLIRLFYSGNKQLAAQMKNRHTAYNKALKQLAEWEKEGRVFVIRPSSPIEIGRLESDEAKMQKVYDMGVQDAKAILPELQAWLNAPAGMPRQKTQPKQGTPVEQSQLKNTTGTSQTSSKTSPKQGMSAQRSG